MPLRKNRGMGLAMRNSTAIKLATVVLSTMSPTLATVCNAAPPSKAIVVRVADLDLTSASGQKKLRLRLMHAVSENCPIGSKCRRGALARAYENADQIITDAKKGSATPDVLHVSPR